MPRQALRRPNACSLSSLAQVIDWVNAKVANHKKLRGGCRVMEAIPKSPSGKILRRVLRDQVKDELAAAKKGKL